MAAAILLVLLVGRMLQQRAPDRQFFPPDPPMPVPNAADTFAEAARLSARHGRVDTILPANADVEKAPIADLRELVAGRRDALAVLRRGLGQPCRFRNIPVSKPADMIGQTDLARTLIAEGRIHESDRDWSAAARSYLDTFRFGSRYMDGNAYRSQGRLVSSSVPYSLFGALLEAYAVRALSRLLDRCDGRTADLIARTLQRDFPAMPTLAELIQAEVRTQEALVQRWGDGKSNATLMEDMIQSRVALTPKDLTPVRFTNRSAFMNQALDTVLVAYYRLNRRATMDAFEQFSADLTSDATGRTKGRLWADFYSGPAITSHIPPTKLIAMWVTPLYAGGWETGGSARDRLIVIKAALRAYAMRHRGAYPRSLAQLRLPHDIVADPYRNAPMVYAPPRRVHGRLKPYKLYSVGPNGKDDGGKSDYPADDILPGE